MVFKVRKKRFTDSGRTGKQAVGYLQVNSLDTVDGVSGLRKG